MIRLNIEKQLKKIAKSRYWLGHQLGMSDYNLKRIIDGKTKSIRFETIEALCQLLECTPNDLIEFY